MRRLLMLTALVIASLVAALMNTETSSAETQVFGFLFRPVGTTGPGGILPLLDCGWHNNCDGYFNDPTNTGLDWKWWNQTYVTTRLRMSLIGPSTITHVADGQLLNTYGSCPYLRVTFRRPSDGAYNGWVRQQHATGQFTNYSWVAGPSYTYDLITGTMVSPWDDDCNANGFHVMQWYVLQPAGNILTKNNDIPVERDCYHPFCDRLYDPWTPAEYAWGWSGPP